MNTYTRFRNSYYLYIYCVLFWFLSNVHVLEQDKKIWQLRFKDCVDSRDSRRSSREIKPKYNARDGEWLISPKFQTKRSPEKHSPQKHSPLEVITSPKRGSRRPHGSESPTPRASASVGRSTRSRRSSVSPTPRTAAGRSPRAAAKTTHETETESEPEDDVKRAESPAFYPSNHHVRFSPSVKTASPFGRKTRSGRRGIGSSFLQTLGSEDEQSAFNRQVCISIGIITYFHN